MSALPKEIDPVLQCPQCMSTRPSLSLVQAESSLTCTQCKAAFPRQPEDGFYSFRTAKMDQGRSLLIHEEEDFYPNSRFRYFANGVTSGQIQHALRVLKPQSLLDVGCGNGAWGVPLSKLVRRYYGIEPSDIPPSRRLSDAERRHLTLVHYNAKDSFPVLPKSVDMVSFLASYDHIPNRIEVLQDAARRVRSGGHVLFVMTNYGFWAKQLVNFLARRQLFKHEHEHYVVHTLKSLREEVKGALPHAELAYVDAEFVMIPNLPKALGWIYFSSTFMKLLNKLLRFVICSVFRRRQSGSAMIVAFRIP